MFKFNRIKNEFIPDKPVKTLIFRLKLQTGDSDDFST